MLLKDGVHSSSLFEINNSGWVVLLSEYVDLCIRLAFVFE